jgi:hypothetical protein
MLGLFGGLVARHTVRFPRFDHRQQGRCMLQSVLHTPAAITGVTRKDLVRADAANDSHVRPLRQRDWLGRALLDARTGRVALKSNQRK